MIAGQAQDLPTRARSSTRCPRHWIILRCLAAWLTSPGAPQRFYGAGQPGKFHYRGAAKLAVCSCSSVGYRTGATTFSRRSDWCVSCTMFALRSIVGSGHHPVISGI